MLRAALSITSVWPGARHDVEEGERLGVLVDLVARNLAAQDLGEDVALIVVGHFVLPVHQSSIAGG
jgi:hypothetical protein